MYSSVQTAHDIYYYLRRSIDSINKFIGLGLFQIDDDDCTKHPICNSMRKCDMDKKNTPHLKKSILNVFEDYIWNLLKHVQI